MARQIHDRREAVRRQWRLVREATAAGDARQAAEALPDADVQSTFFAALACWAEDGLNREPFVLAFCEALLARLNVADLHSDWDERRRTILRWCAWLAGRDRWFPEPIECRLADREPLNFDGLDAASRDAAEEAALRRQPHLALATLNVLYEFSPWASAPPEGRPRERLLRLLLALRAASVLESMASHGEPEVFRSIRRLLREAAEEARGLLEAADAEDRLQVAPLLARALSHQAAFLYQDPLAALALLRQGLELLAQVRDPSASWQEVRRGCAVILLLRTAGLEIKLRRFSDAAAALDQAAIELTAGPRNPDALRRLAELRLKAAVLQAEFTTIDPWLAALAPPTESTDAR
jgi:hypothetical protein